MIPLLLPLAVSLGLPLFFMAWAAGPWVGSRLEGLVVGFLAVSYVALVVIAGPIWGWVGLDIRWLFVALLVPAIAAMLWRWPRRPWLPRRRVRGLANVAFVAAVAALVAYQVAVALRGGNVPPGAVDLAFPLASGEYLVLHGGSTRAVNRHHGVQAQRYALDIVALGPDERRAEGIMPEEVEEYAIYGRQVLAPCAGEVLEASGGAADTPIGGSDPSAPAGNHATLACRVDGAEYTVLLAHLAPGSLAVAPGDAVAVGDVVGAVGSSGNSSEPHLHIQAVRGRVTGDETLIATGRPVPLTFGGRFLVRNDVVEH